MSGDNCQQMSSAVEFFDQNPVFRVEVFHASCCRDAKRGSRANLLNYFVRRGRILPIRRGVYAVVPHGRRPETFQANRYLVASMLRPDVALSHHTALEVLGQAHGMSRTLYGFTAKSSDDFFWNNYRFKMLRYPHVLHKTEDQKLGLVTREIDRELVTLTGPERTLADCLASPQYAGGVEEALVSLRGFTMFDFQLLDEYLHSLRNKRVFAAVGAFLEQDAKRLFVPNKFLCSIEKERPKSRTYLERYQRGGGFLKRWNLIVPRSFIREEISLEV